MNRYSTKAVNFLDAHRPKTIWNWLGVLFIVAVLFLAIVTIELVGPVNALNNLENRKIPQSTKIYDRTGTVLLYDLHSAAQRTVVPLSQMPANLKNAVISIEDHTFYTNQGVAVSSMGRAFLADIQSGGFSQGGSTITQQVAKNVLLTNTKTPLRKVKEVILALLMTKKYTKDQILETYLNETPYGGSLYGVQEASETFFGKNVSELDLAESAYIAAMPKAPTHYSPYGKYRTALDTRKNLVLDQMLKYGYITQAQHDSAQIEAVTFLNKTPDNKNAPTFVDYIIKYVTSKYGVDAVNYGGLKIVTTLDWGLEQQAEKTVATVSTTNAKNYNATNAGLIAEDPKTGQILAMVGSANYATSQYNVTTALRQPGSAFKPFVYATAFEKGYTPNTVVFDLNTQFSTTCAANDFTTGNGCYSPKNFDLQEHGPVSLRDAIGNSLNIASVKVLYLAGIQASISTAQSMGITTLTSPQDYGLSLVLGGGDVTLLDMTSAYGVFANDGVQNINTPILSITNGKGTILEAYQQKPKQVIDASVAQTMSNVLSDNNARSITFGENSPLNLGSTVAVKTGTSNDYRDVWTIGYTSGIVIGAWVGNNDNSPMAHKLSSYIVAPIWNQVMQYAMNKYPQIDYSQYQTPLGSTPTLAGDWNPDPTQGVHDILYWLDKTNPTGSQPTNPLSDAQTAHWDYSVQKWAATNNPPQTPNPLAPPVATTTPQLQSPSCDPTVTPCYMPPPPADIYQPDQTSYPQDFYPPQDQNNSDQPPDGGDGLDIPTNQ